jgi:hypothetical protein
MLSERGSDCHAVVSFRPLASPMDAVAPHPSVFGPDRIVDADTQVGRHTKALALKSRLGNTMPFGRLDIGLKDTMTKITQAALVSAIQQIEHMDSKAREAACDEIFLEQPNLLASVLVLTRMAVSPRYIEVVLEALIVTHLALKESRERVETITEEEQERELQRLVASVKFTEGLEPALVDESIRQYIGFHGEPWLLVYVMTRLHENELLTNANEDSKYVILSALNLVGCIASARRRT